MASRRRFHPRQPQFGHAGDQLKVAAAGFGQVFVTAALQALVAPADPYGWYHKKQRQQQRQDILDTLREQNRRRNSKSSSDGGPSKEDKLGSRTQRQANWGDDDGGQFLSWSKTEPKTEYLSVRGLPENVPAEAVMAAIEMELTDG
jgi:hypothetical protein